MNLNPLCLLGHRMWTPRFARGDVCILRCRRVLCGHSEQYDPIDVRTDKAGNVVEIRQGASRLG